MPAEGAAGEGHELASLRGRIRDMPLAGTAETLTSFCADGDEDMVGVNGATQQTSVGCEPLRGNLEVRLVTVPRVERKLHDKRSVAIRGGAAIEENGQRKAVFFQKDGMGLNMANFGGTGRHARKQSCEKDGRKSINL